MEHNHGGKWKGGDKEQKWKGWRWAGIQTFSNSENPCQVVQCIKY